MDPSRAVLDSWTSLQDILDFVNIGDAGAELLTHLGMDPADHPRVLAILQSNDYDALIQSWRLSGAVLSPGQLAKVALVGRLARLATKVILTSEEQEEAEKLKHT